MDKRIFDRKHQHLNIAAQELERKYKAYLREQEEMQLMLEAAEAAARSSSSTAGGGSAVNISSGVLTLGVNTENNSEMKIIFVSTGEPINFTIDWGDGTIHEDSGLGGYYEEFHTYDNIGDYVITVTFDDPLKVLELDFPGDDDGYANLTTISGLQAHKNLQEFRADYNSLVTVDLSNLTNLRYVDISDCDEVNTGGPSLTNVILTGCTSLEELRLDDSDFSGGIPNLTGLNSLRYIDFDDCGITGSVDISFLPALDDFDFSQNTGLTELIISSSQPLGFNGQYLNASGCGLTESSVDAILVALSQNGISGGEVDLLGGTNATPSSAGLAAKTILEETDWAVIINTP